MSIEVCLICDRCGVVLAGAATAKRVRADARALYQRRNNRDICITCEPLSSGKQLKSQAKSADPVQHPWGGAF